MILFSEGRVTLSYSLPNGNKLMMGESLYTHTAIISHHQTNKKDANS